MSVAVTLIMRSSRAPGGTVPENTPLTLSKVSQAGSGCPETKLAVNVRGSPASTSAKVSKGSAKAKPVPSIASWSAIGFATVGAVLPS